MQQPVIATKEPALAVDLSHLARYTMGNLSLDVEILGLFVGQAPQTIARMEASAEHKRWREAAHTLKGSARGVGAWTLGELAASAELSPAWNDPAARAALIGEIRRALADVAAFLRDLQASGR